MLRIVSLLFVISLSSLIARADTVTSGSYRFQGAFGSLTEVLQFSGTTFSVNGFASTQSGITLPAMFTCFTCTSGTSVSLSSNALLVGGDFAGGTVTVNGISHSLFTTTSDMSFSAGTVIVPITSDPFITLSAPFSLTSGSLSGPGFGVGFTGGGFASLSLTRVGTDASGNSLYRFSGLSYTFTEPVPEPASMLLFLTGVLALPVMFRKRNPRS
jgi:hypothetical protein